jgi:hypothetical protein
LGLASITPLVAAINIWVPDGSIGNSGSTYVGIGTSAPNEKLEVLGSIQTSGATAGMSRLVLQSTASGGQQYEWYNDFIGAGSGVLGLYNRTSGNNPIAFTAAGNVGIGTTNPWYKLVVSNGGGAGLEFDPTGTQLSGGVGIQGYNRSTSSYVPILVYGSKLLLDGGNVGIGTTSPAAKLDVRGGYIMTAVSGAASRAFMEGNTGGAYFGSQDTADIHIGNANSWDYIFVKNGGNVGIGTTSPGSYKLAVNGPIRAKEIVVDTGWSDYVFDESYQLSALSEVERFIKEKKHLPGIPSAAEVEQEGVSLGDMQARLLAKIEELTLHQIAQAKRLDAQAARIAALENENRTLRNR